MQLQDAPLLSVIVVIVSDTTDSGADTRHLEQNLEALEQQQDAPSFEVIVPYHPGVKGIEAARKRFPQVRFLAVSDLKSPIGKGHSREHHDELRARGLQAAKGRIVGLLEDHARPDRNWCAAMAREHSSQECAAVGGPIANGVDRILNWAVFFCDFYKYLQPVPEGESAIASDANISYKREALEKIPEVWGESFHETRVNWELSRIGAVIRLSRAPMVSQFRMNLALKKGLKERFIWGKSYAASRSKLIPSSSRLLYAALTPVLPFLLLSRIGRTVLARKSAVGPFFRAVPLIFLLLTAWSAGELSGYLGGR